MSKKQQLAAWGVTAFAFIAENSQAAALASDAFGSIQSDTIGTIAVAAGMGVAIMGVGIGWDVGMSLVKKFVKRGAK